MHPSLRDILKFIVVTTFQTVQELHLSSSLLSVELSHFTAARIAQRRKTKRRRRGRHLTRAWRLSRRPVSLCTHLHGRPSLSLSCSSVPSSRTIPSDLRTSFRRSYTVGCFQCIISAVIFLKVCILYFHFVWSSRLASLVLFIFFWKIYKYLTLSSGFFIFCWR